MKKVTVLLRDVRAGFRRLCEYEIEDENAESHSWMWEDGNYACDCNRSIYLYGLHYNNAWPCGSGKIACLSLKIDDVEVYAEKS